MTPAHEAPPFLHVKSSPDGASAPVLISCYRILQTLCAWQMNGFASSSQHKADSQTNGDIKLEDADQASVSDDEVGQNGRGRKRLRRGKDKKVVQPVRSYPTRERAKAEAEVEAEVSLLCDTSVAAVFLVASADASLDLSAWPPEVVWMMCIAS